MEKFPTWTVICATSVMLFGGVAIASSFLPNSDTHKLTLLAQAPPALFLGIGIPVYAIETLLFTVAPIEAAARFVRMPLLGASAGLLGYGVLYHWPGGLTAILVASWIALVLNASYLMLRVRSKRTAILSTVGQKIAFLLFAAYSIYGFGA